MGKGRTLVIVSLSYLGCLPEFTQVQGEHILYEHSDELHPCAGSAAYLDDVVPFLAQQLGVKAPTPLRYAWLVDEDVPGLSGDRSEGGLHLKGRAIGQFAWAESPVLVHEVAHMVAGGRASPPFFSEGIATAMDIIEDNGGGPRYVFDVVADPRVTMAAERSIDVDFRAAGLFVTFILVRRGPERLRAFYRRLTWPFSLGRIEAEFQQVYGVSLQEEVELFMQGVPPCEADHFDVNLSECTGATVDWEDDRNWRLTESMSCDAPGVVGGIGPDRVWPSFRVVTVDVPTSAVYVLRNNTTGQESVRFGPCFGCPWDFKDVFVFADEKVPLQLEAGKYFVRVNGESDKMSDIDISLQLAF